MPAIKPVSKSFDAVLERTNNNLGWVIIRVPLDVSKVWGTRGQLKVTGDINGFDFRSCLFPTRAGVHFMIVNKKMQAGGKVQPSMKARFRMQPDVTVRKVSPSAELLRVLRESKRLSKYYESLNNSTRKYIAEWVAEGKESETRARRAEQLAVRLMETMEAERELPPLLQQALSQNPKARAGWKIMPPAQRRGHLMGIFGYRNPESRARRAAKAVEAMVEYAEKREQKHE